MSIKTHNTPSRQRKDTQAVVALSCGGREREPGKSPWDPINDAIARRAARYAKLMNVPILAQWEVADILPYPHKAAFRVTKHRKEGKYLDTREVMDQIHDYAKAKGITNIAIVAHPLHLSRVALVARKLGFNAYAIYSPNISLDPHSKQWWTRTPLLFRMRERLVMAYYAWKCWI